MVLLQWSLVFSLGPWYFMAILAIMAFDAPGSERTVFPYLMAVPLWLYPVVALGCSVLAWAHYRRGEEDRAVGTLLLPYAYASVVPLLWVVLDAIREAISGLSS